jgi:hypothetical protein
LTGTVDQSVDVPIYVIDGDNPRSVVDQLHAKGRKAICYFDAGSWESYRADAREFPMQALSEPNPEWPDERWIDLRQLDSAWGPTGKTIRELLTARIDVCAAKGFDAIDPDMTEVHTATTRFPAGGRPSAADNEAFVRWLARTAHERGMAAGLKGNFDQVAALVDAVDFTVNEQCAQYNECDRLLPFIRAGKPVFHIEYDRTAAQFCPYDRANRFSGVRKRLSLDAWAEPC